MAECPIPPNTSSPAKPKFEKKKTLLKYLRAKRNLKKKNKKKRAKAKYYKNLERRRADRRTEDLCAEIQYCGVTDMEWTPSGEPPEFSDDAVPPELSEWHKQDQIAYWKSRAISLELENRMLHRALRDVYAQQIVDYQKSVGTYQEETYQEEAQTYEQNYDQEQEAEEEYPYDENEEFQSAPGTVLYTAPQPSTSTSKKKSTKKKKYEDNPPEEPEVVPKFPEGRNRLEKMIELYGDKAEKIMGMETAIQLNFERREDQTKPIYWPNLPLKL